MSSSVESSVKHSSAQQRLMAAAKNLAGHLTVSKRRLKRQGAAPPLPVCLTSPSPLRHFSSLWRTFLWTTICLESQTCHTYPPLPKKKSLCASFLHKQKESAASVVHVEELFVPASKLTLATTGIHPNDNTRVWSSSGGYLGSGMQF